MSSSLVDTVVVGGGLAGLFYAYLFSQAVSLKDKQLVLLEKQYQLGGRVKSWKVEDQLSDTSSYLELGPARFSSEHNVLKNLLQELNIEFKEYGSKPICTYRSPWLYQFPSGQEQVLASYPNLTAEERKILSSYNYNGLRLLVATTSPVASSNENLETFLKKKLQSSTLAAVCLESTGWNSLKYVQASEAHWIVQEMYGPNLHWFSTQQPLSELASRLVQKCLESKRISFRLNSEVLQVTDTTVQYRSGNDETTMKCRNVVLALDLPSLQKMKLATLPKNLASFPVLRIYAHFSEPWIQKGFPVLYTASPLGLVIPSSVPGWMQVSYTDGDDTRLWLDLLERVPNADKKVLDTQVWSITITEDSLIWLRLRKELLHLLPGSTIPKPSVLLMHLCQVMYPLPYADSHEEKSELTIIGEAVCLHEKVGITSAWMESALRTALKGFINNESANVQPSSLNRFWRKN